MELPDSVKRAALAIEAFHKASLVHDDIEDDDTFRYGANAASPVRRRHRDQRRRLSARPWLSARQPGTQGTRRRLAADILDKLADAHLKLSEGQGAELLWRDAPDKALTALDALKIYALKTAPAFEAALYSGVRLAGPSEKYEKAVTDFSQHLGVAFQILNDLKDWDGDRTTNCSPARTCSPARPTLLLALALEGLSGPEKGELLGLISAAREHDSSDDNAAVDTVERVRGLYRKAKVFTKADVLIEKYRSRAESIADEIEPTEFRELLYYLVDTVLEKGNVADDEPKEFAVELGLPVR